ncbi:MAG: hypothetical protein Q8O67_34280 [Deltaproteobacteria bacterium]|nr:hypothetical protein [Deltaproteobacteria bacterium]
MRIFLPLAAVVAVVSGSCSASRGFCEASADCDAEIFGQAIDAAGDADDDVAVCTALQDGQTAALRANEEEECQDVASAREAYFACVASEFDGDNGCDAVSEDCDDELDDLAEAQEDVSGDECTSSEE